MKNKLSPVFYLRFIPFVFLLALSACSDNDAPKDELAPEVIITGIDENATVSNTISLTVNASDDNGISTIEIYVDDVLFNTLTKPPFDISWDSNTVQDGAHTFKVVAIDKAGNKKEETFTVTVKNILLDIKVPAHTLAANERAFIYLSDADGKLIASTEYINGKNVELKSSSFNDGAFYLTELLYSPQSLYKTMAWTYVQIQRGRTWYGLFPTSDEDQPVGKATLNFTGDEDSFQQYTFSSNAEMAELGFHETQYAIDLATNTSSLFVMKNEPDVAYGLFQGIKVNTQNTIDLTQVNKPMIKKTVVSPDDEDAMIDVFFWGYPVANDYTNGYAFDDYQHIDLDSKAYFYYPGNAFPSYFHEVWWQTDHIDYTKRGRGTDVEVKLPTVTFSHEFKNNKLTYSIAGDFELFYMTMYGDDAIWFFTVPKGKNQSIPAFEQPAILKDINKAPFGSIAEYGISEIESIEGYDDYMAKLKSVASINQNDFYFENTVDITYSIESENGRKTKRDKKSHHNFLKLRR